MNRHTFRITVVLIVIAATLCTLRLCRSRWTGAQSETDADAADTEPYGAVTPVYEFSLLNDETRAFCRSNRDRIDIRNVHSGEVLDSLDFQGKLPIGISAASRDELLLAAYLDGSLVLWAAAPGSNRYQPKLLARDPGMASCALSPDGRLAATGQNDGTVVVRDARTGALRHRLQAHAGCIFRIGFSHNGSRVYTARRTVCVWDANSGSRLAKYPARGRELGCLEFFDDNRSFVTADQNFGSVTLWNAETATARWSIHLDNRTVTTVAINPDQRTLVCGNTAGQVWLCDVKSGRRTGMIPDPITSIVSCVKFSADGARLYIGRHDGSISIWELKRMRGNPNRKTNTLANPGQASGS